MPYLLGSVCHIFCRNPLILTDFYAIGTPLVWHIFGASFFANMAGGGGQNYFQIIFRNHRKGGTASLRSRTCVKRNVVFGARCKGLFLCIFYIRKGI